MVFHLVHLVFEVLEVAFTGLVEKGVAVGQKQNALLYIRFSQPVHNVRSRERFAGAGGHYQQNLALAFSHGLHRAVDSNLLVVARAAATTVEVVFLFGHAGCHRRGQALGQLVACPQRGRRRKIGKGQLGFHGAIGAGRAVMKQKTVVVGADTNGISRMRA